MILQDNMLFKNVDQAVIELLEENVLVKKCMPKNTIVREEILSSPKLYIVKSGVVMISKTDASGSEVAFSLKRDGDPFNMFSIVDEKPRNGKAVALLKTEYWILNNSFVKKTLLKDANFAFNLLKNYAHYIRESESFYASSSSGSAQKKLLFQLMRIGRKSNIEGFLIIDNEVNQTIISSFTGVTRETVSREIQKLKKSSVIKINKYNQLELDVTLANDLLETG